LTDRNDAADAGAINEPMSKVERLTQALLRDRERPAAPQPAPARCFTCEHPYRPRPDAGGSTRFCSPRCRGAFDAGVPPRGANPGSELYEFTAGLVVVAGGDPGYLPTMRMRKGAVGFYIDCRACGAEFDSKGLAYCATCSALPAEERRAMRPAKARRCEAPGCESFVTRTARAGAMYCSEACKQRAYRARCVTDNPARLPLQPTPENVTDNEQKNQ
jgi:hypothetical protein